MSEKFVKQSARPLPVILLLDVSGSMYGNKVDALNSAVREMIEAFAQEENTRVEIHASIITFGGRANIHTNLLPASEISWSDMSANGGTPLGEALDLATDLINDKEKLPSRAFRPTIILVSDGQPNDNWQSKMNAFINEGRTGKCDRWALGIGEDADIQMLSQFMNDKEKRVLRAEDASDISKFFRFVSDTITQRSRSVNPNKVSTEAKAFNPFGDDDDIDF